MIFCNNGDVRLTCSEFNTLRRANAKNGVALNRVGTADELLEAAIDGLNPTIQDDLLQFLETGSSPLTRQSDPSR